MAFPSSHRVFFYWSFELFPWLFRELFESFFLAIWAFIVEYLSFRYRASWKLSWNFHGISIFFESFPWLLRELFWALFGVFELSWLYIWAFDRKLSWNYHGISIFLWAFFRFQIIGVLNFFHGNLGSFLRAFFSYLSFHCRVFELFIESLPGSFHEIFMAFPFLLGAFLRFRRFDVLNHFHGYLGSFFLAFLRVFELSWLYIWAFDRMLSWNFHGISIFFGSFFKIFGLLKFRAFSAVFFVLLSFW